MTRHIAGIAEIVEDVSLAVRFYREALGLNVEHEEGAGYALVDVQGTLHFGIWSRASAAEATFGDPNAANRIPLGFTIGFEVDAAEAASKQLESAGWPVAQPPKTEPWGQVTSRFFSPSGALCEVAETPNARRVTQAMKAE